MAIKSFLNENPCRYFNGKRFQHFERRIHRIDIRSIINIYSISNTNDKKNKQFFEVDFPVSIKKDQEKLSKYSKIVFKIFQLKKPFIS